MFIASPPGARTEAVGGIERQAGELLGLSAVHAHHLDQHEREYDDEEHQRDGREEPDAGDGA